MAGIVLKATSMAAAAASSGSGRKGITNEVTFSYFGLMGRGDPLRQMFEYHG